MLRPVFSRRIAGLLAIAVLAGAAALGGYLASQAFDGTTAAQEVEQEPTPTPWQGPGAPPIRVVQNDPAVAPTTPPATSEPTPEPPLTPLPLSPTPRGPTPPATMTATPTPEPGVCPTPRHTTPADFAQPPPVRPASEIPGQRFQGGVPYSAAYVTAHLPAGREFIIASAWSQDESNLAISIYDVQGESQLIVRGDGCEISRFVRQPAADAVFDEMMSSLEIGSTYACPVPVRITPEDLPVPDQPPPADGSGLPGRRVQGGVPFELGPITLHLPAGREFLVGGGIADPGGEFFTVADAQTHSGLFLRPDGCEISRVSYPADDAVLDEIVRTLEVQRR